MKVLYCKSCNDIVVLTTHSRRCRCRRTSGLYLEDGHHAEYDGPCVPIGFANESLLKAIQSQPQSGPGYRFDAFVIPHECPTMRKRPR